MKLHEKKRMYGQRVRDVEDASFTPLVFFGNRGNEQGDRGVPETPPSPQARGIPAMPIPSD